MPSFWIWKINASRAVPWGLSSMSIPIEYVTFKLNRWVFFDVKRPVSIVTLFGFREISVLSMNIFVSNCSYQEIECSVDYPALNLSKKLTIFRSRFGSVEKKTRLYKKVHFSSKSSYRHMKSSSDNPAETFPGKGQKNHPVSENDKNFLEKNCFSLNCSSWHVK